jgi:hypothetical protein
MVNFLVGKWQAARSAFEEAENIFLERCTGVMSDLGATYQFLFYSLWYLGDLHEMSRRLPTLTIKAQERGDLFLELTLKIRAADTIMLAADDAEKARRQARAAGARSLSNDFQLQHFYATMADLNILLYQGNAEVAWDSLHFLLPALSRSALSRIRNIEIILTNVIARCALARAVAAQGGRDSADALRTAQQAANKLDKMRSSYMMPYVSAFYAAIAHMQGDKERAVDLLAEAQTGFKSVDMALMAVAAQRARGQLMGEQSGKDLIAQADDFMSEKNIARPLNFTAMLLPGFS